MKELYNSPILNVICFAPVERLATGDDLDFDNLVDVNVPGEEAKVSEGTDIDIIL